MGKEDRGVHGPSFVRAGALAGDRRRYQVVIVQDGGAEGALCKGVDAALAHYVNSPGSGREAGDAHHAREAVWHLPVGGVYEGSMGWVMRLRDAARPGKPGGHEPPPRWSEIKKAAKIITTFDRWRRRTDGRIRALETAPVPASRVEYKGEQDTAVEGVYTVPNRTSIYPSIDVKGMAWGMRARVVKNFGSKALVCGIEVDHASLLSLEEARELVNVLSKAVMVARHLDEGGDTLPWPPLQDPPK